VPRAGRLLELLLQLLLLLLQRRLRGPHIAEGGLLRPGHRRSQRRLTSRQLARLWRHEVLLQVERLAERRLHVPALLQQAALEGVHLSVETLLHLVVVLDPVQSGEEVGRRRSTEVVRLHVAARTKQSKLWRLCVEQSSAYQ